MRLFLLYVMTLLVGAPLLSAAPNTKVFISSSSRTDRPAKTGDASSEAQAIARQMEIFAAEALQNQFPCAQALTPQDVSDMLNWERQKELLGNPDDNALKAIGDSLGAGYLLNFQITQTGGRIFINGSAMNLSKNSTAARDGVTLSRNDGLVDSMEAFARKFAAELGDAGYHCPAWNGTVSITTNRSGDVAGNDGAKAHSEYHLQENCRVHGDDAQCTVNFNSSLSGKNSNYTGSASGTEPASVSVGNSGGKATITVSMVKVKGSNTLNTEAGEASSETEESFGAWDVEGGTAAADRSSGAWSDGAGTTITWDLKLQ